MRKKSFLHTYIFTLSGTPCLEICEDPNFHTVLYSFKSASDVFFQSLSENVFIMPSNFKREREDFAKNGCYMLETLDAVECCSTLISSISWTQIPSSVSPMVDSNSNLCLDLLLV